MPPISKSSVGTPFFISFLGFTYIELQVYKLFPKSEFRFYLGGMTLISPNVSTVMGMRSQLAASFPCEFMLETYSLCKDGGSANELNPAKSALKISQCLSKLL